MNPTTDTTERIDSHRPGRDTGGDALARLFSANGDTFMADGGLETTLIFLHGLDLPDFAAFPLLDTETGRRALRSYYEPYLDLAAARQRGMVLDTPTWRANPDWGVRLGYDEAAIRTVNQTAAAFIAALASERPDVDVVLNGAIGPRGDGYVVGATMGAIEASSYHATQIEALATGGVEMITAVTMTYVDEAIGVATAAAAVGLPASIGLTVETDGRLPSGQSLPAAIEAIDEATGGSPAWYMVNCAHPSHFEHVLNGAAAPGGDDWLGRIRAIRANASKMSHAELDAAPELDRGDLPELAADYRRLRETLPDLAVVGGCCGTDHEHLDAITSTLG